MKSAKELMAEIMKDFEPKDEPVDLMDEPDVPSVQADEEDASEDTSEPNGELGSASEPSINNDPLNLDAVPEVGTTELGSVETSDQQADEFVQLDAPAFDNQGEFNAEVPEDSAAEKYDALGDSVDLGTTGIEDVEVPGVEHTAEQSATWPSMEKEVFEEGEVPGSSETELGAVADPGTTQAELGDVDVPEDSQADLGDVKFPRLWEGQDDSLDSNEQPEIGDAALFDMPDDVDLGDSGPNGEQSSPENKADALPESGVPELDSQELGSVETPELSEATGGQASPEDPEEITSLQESDDPTVSESQQLAATDVDIPDDANAELPSGNEPSVETASIESSALPAIDVDMPGEESVPEMEKVGFQGSTYKTQMADGTDVDQDEHDPSEPFNQKIEAQFAFQQKSNEDLAAQLAEQLNPAFDEMRMHQQQIVSEYMDQKILEQKILSQPWGNV